MVESKCPWCGAGILTMPGEPVECWACPYTLALDQEMDHFAGDLDKLAQQYDQRDVGDEHQKPD